MISKMKRLVFIGDSLTEWYNWQSRFPEYRVTNLGISGERVEELRQRLPAIHAEVTNPDAIFLMTGINNIGYGDYNIIETYRAILNDLATHYKTAKLVLQSVLPVTLEGIDNHRIREINLQLKALTQEFHAAYLDIHPLFLDAVGNPRRDYLQEDGVHLSSKGYAVWADEVERFLIKARATERTAR